MKEVFFLLWYQRNLLMKAPEEQNSRANSCLEPTPPCAFHQALQVEAFVIQTCNFVVKIGQAGIKLLQSLPLIGHLCQSAF